MNEVGVQYNDHDIDMDDFAQDCSPQTGLPRFTQKDNSKNTSRKVAPPGSKPTIQMKRVCHKKMLLLGQPGQNQLQMNSQYYQTQEVEVQEE